MPRITLAAVAEALGVSPMTVSNAYNHPERLSAELRARVLAVAEELGYPGPHPTARSLRRGRANAIGVVLGEALTYAFEDPGAVEFLRGLAAGSASAGLALHVVPAAGREADPALVLDALVDCFVLFALTDEHPLVDAVLRRGLPCVVHGGPELPGHSLVGIDDRAAARAAAEHVRGLGHDRVAAVCFPLDGERRDGRIAPDTVIRHPVGRARLAGYGDAVDLCAVHEVSVNTRDRGEAVATELLAGASPPTAILCMSDELAIGALRAAAARGLDVPGDVSIVGWDDTSEAVRAEPPLTTIRQSLRDHGRICAELLVENGPPVRRLEPWELVIRGSTGHVPGSS